MHGYRLSPAQRRIVALGETEAFATCATVRFRGPFDAAARSAALRALVQQHEILRTSFRSVPGVAYPLQVIENEAVLSGEDEDEGCWRVTLPALVADAATMRVLARDLAARLAGVPAGEPMQFADVAEWQNEMANDDATPWIVRGTRATSGAFRVATLRRRVEAIDPSRLLAAWLVLLLRRQVTDGVAWLADGRGADELRGVAGPLSRYLPLDVAFRDEDPFEDLVVRVAEALRRDAGRQETFSWERLMPSSHFVAGFDCVDLDDDLIDVESRLDRFDVRLTCCAGDRGALVSFEYDAARFDHPAIERLADGLEALVASARGHVKAGDLEIMGVSERTLVIDTFNATDVRHELRPVHQLLHDDSIVVAGDASFSTGELKARAAAIAFAFGAAAGGRVALFFERGVDMVAAMLACIESGAAYVPIDPDYPQARVAAILADARPIAILTTSALAAALPPHDRIIRTDETPSAPASAPDARTSPDDAAYVLYTSGSTGDPKGVVVGHRSLANHMLWMQRVYPLAADDVVLQKTPYVFDASVWEFWAPLIAGARLVIAAPAAHRNASTLIDEIARHGVTVLQVVPTMLALLVADPRFASCTTLRRVFVGGEVLTPERARRFAAVSRAELVNLYGPTETTIEVAGWTCTEPGERVPLGRPIDNARIYVLDPHLRPVPVGARGEICIGGSAVAHGYHARPGLTAERFVPDPFREGRVYRSGDLGTWRTDGTLDYYGRADDQIKVRGVRVELAEVDAVAAVAPGVHRAAAVHDRELDRIVCWYSGAAAEEAVRGYVEERLPAGSAPSLYVRIDELPCTTSGKTDRRALAAMNPVAAQRRTPPRDALELRLCRIWERTLGVPRIGITDSFFDAGGHSLLAVALAAAIEKELNYHLPLSAIFTARTIEAQAALLRQRAPAVRTPLVPIRTGGARPLFLVHPTGGNVLCYAELADHLGADQPLYGLQDPGLYESSSPYASLEEMAALYIEAIREAQQHGPYLLGGWSSGGVIAFEMAQQLRRAGEDIALLALFDSQAPLDAIPVDDSRLVTSVAKLLAWMADAEERESTSVDDLADLGRAARLLPPDAGDADVRQLFSVFRSNVDAVSRYTPCVYPRRVTLFRATEPLPDRVRLSAMHRPPKTATFGWESLATVRAYDVPGHHLNMIAAPHVRALSQRLRASIEDANRIYEFSARSFFSIAAH